MTTFATSWRTLLYYPNPQITANRRVIACWKTALPSPAAFIKLNQFNYPMQKMAFLPRSTYCLVPVGQSVVVVLQESAAVLGQTLDSLQPQSTGQLLTVARPRSFTATTASQRADPAQLQHRRHEDVSQPAVPRHAVKSEGGFVGRRSGKVSVFGPGETGAGGKAAKKILCFVFAFRCQLESVISAIWATSSFVSVRLLCQRIWRKRTERVWLLQ